jgi:hypothetical protein
VNDKKVNELLDETFEKLRKGEVDTKHVNAVLGLGRYSLQRINTGVRYASATGRTFKDGYFTPDQFEKKEK